ncbi:Male sterility NAD-binding [Penicillium freii]|nr:Male sterility NAD-binding [Penicillium freii]
MSCSAETTVDLQRRTVDRFRAKYTAGLGDGHTVILTGSTGSLGSYSLESLVHQQQKEQQNYLGVLPSTLESLNRVDWIPVDLLADILIQLAGVATNGTNGVNGTANGSSATAHTLPVYHAVNPNAVDWASLVPMVANHLGRSIKIVSWAD